MTKNRNTTAIAIFMLFAFASTLVVLPLAGAHSPPWEIQSFAYLVAKPDPVGVGQQVFILMWVDTPLPSASVSNDIRRHDYTLTITKPDGTKETKHWDVIQDTTNIQYFTYVPNTVGQYALKFDYAGQVYTWSGTWNNDTLLPVSKELTFTVQEEPLPQARSSYPLPTEYWTRPIEGQNTDWYAISSNWLRDPFIETGGTTRGGQQPDGIGPNSPHIMWSKPLQDGGVVGGNEYDALGKTYYMGGSYNVRFDAPIVMYGRLYYEEQYGNSGGDGDYICVDLQTGKEVWRIAKENVKGYPSFGYLYSFDSGNQHGILPNGALFTNNFAKSYDPRTGRLTEMNVTNVPSGTAVAGPQGEVIRFVLSNLGTSSSPKYYLMQWNSSKVIGAAGTGFSPSNWYSGNLTANAPITPAPSGTNTYWNGSMWVNSTVRTQQGLASITQAAYDWNITLSLGPGNWSISRASFNNMMLLTQGSFGSGPRSATTGGANITAINLKPGSIGQVMWTRHYDEPTIDYSRSICEWDPVNGVFVMVDKEITAFHGFSLSDGSPLWSTDGTGRDLDFFRTSAQAAYGKLYHASYGGVLTCYDVKSGDILWTYGNGGEGNSTFAGLETAWGHYPIFINCIADGKIYVAITEHSPGSPFYKDVRYRCVNASDGKEIWQLMGWGTGMDATYDIVADGCFVFLNCYDMQVYCVGKGPSAITVEAPMTGAKLGDSVVIRGLVTDVAAGTEQDVIARRFPNGVPAMSDKSMSLWMEYVYMQKPKPTDATGVPVSINVIDSNGNQRNIGTAVSDSTGMFAMSWSPDIEGDYKVIARFAGSESYWPSSAETFFVVDPAPAPTQAPEYPQPVDNSGLLYGILGGVIAAIIIGLAAVFLSIRKK